MAKKDMPEAAGEQKVQTRYDRKMEERKKKAEKDLRDEKITKIVSVTVGAAVAAAIIIFAAISIINKSTALNSAYVKIGDHEVTKVEYDYYYNNTVNNYLTTYASILPYMGLDTSADFKEQQYSEDMSWKDLFDQMTVGQLTQVFALVDDAAANGYSYDVTEDYESRITSIEEAAKTADTTVTKYYKTTFGKYATAKNIESPMKDGILAGAYYNELLAGNAPSEEEVKEYYEEHAIDYDKVDYRSFVFPTSLAEDASEDEISAAMTQAKEKADAMAEERKAGRDFEELCIQNASEETKANYEDTETEYSLTEGSYYSSIPSLMSPWLYEDGRTAGEITVLEDETNHQYYVVEFLNRYYDEADDANISNTIASDKVTAYISALIENYEVTDVKGDLKYLTLDVNTEEAAEETSQDAAEEAEQNTEAASETEEAAPEAETSPAE